MILQNGENRTGEFGCGESGFSLSYGIFIVANVLDEYWDIGK